MDLGDGLFVSRTSAQDWEADPDVPGTTMHEVVKRDGVWVGMSRIDATDGPIVWTPESRETALILEGAVRIEFEGRPQPRAQPRRHRVVSAGPGDDLARHHAVQGAVDVRRLIAPGIRPDR